MTIISNMLLVILVFGLFVSVLFALGNGSLKEKSFYLVMSIVLLLSAIGLMYFKLKIGIWQNR